MNSITDPTWQSFITQSSIENFQEAIPHFLPQQWTSIFDLLQNSSHSASQNKLKALFDYIAQHNHFDQLGAFLSSQSFVAFTSFVLFHSLDLKHLGTTLIHLPQVVFSESLPKIQSLLTRSHLEKVLEPVCYQLTLFIHAYENHLEQTQQKINHFQQQIHSIDSFSMASFNQDIEQIDQRLQKDLSLLNIALEIAWQTERSDIIAKLSDLKEKFMRFHLHQIGSPETPIHPSSGIYALIEQSLAMIFNTSLKDSDSALEGLACLKLWQIKDYWEIGLLPYLPSPLVADAEQQKKAIEQVQKNLSRLDLHQVKDLKRKHLFSAQLLKHYITSHQELLT